LLTLSASDKIIGRVSSGAGAASLATVFVQRTIQNRNAQDSQISYSAAISGSFAGTTLASATGAIRHGLGAGSRAVGAIDQFRRHGDAGILSGWLFYRA